MPTSPSCATSPGRTPRSGWPKSADSPTSSSTATWAFSATAPANFLDAGGGSKADEVVTALEVLLSDPKVGVLLINIFGGITRGDEVAQGLITAFEQVKPGVPFVVRLDATNDKEGRALLAEAGLPNVQTEATMLGAAERVVELAG
ncbi:MAG: hypothetical protein M3550_01635 [Actinomycetota bacterium]|nr:hypothetical protein [Actinomycetota bacterium]